MQRQWYLVNLCIVLLFFFFYTFSFMVAIVGEIAYVTHSLKSFQLYLPPFFPVPSSNVVSWLPLLSPPLPHYSANFFPLVYLCRTS